MSMLPEDPYGVLGVSKGADHPTIKTAYRKLILKCHPDKTTDIEEKADRQARFFKIQKAYELLGDEDSRRKYDLEVRRHELINFEERARWQMHGADPPPERRRGSGSYMDEYLRRPEREKKSRPVDPDRMRVEREIEERNKRAQRHFKEGAGEPVSQENKEDVHDSDEEQDLTTPRPPRPKEKPKFSSVPPAQLGMRVMNPEHSDAAAVDIVAVHGLGAIPDITWKDSVSGVNWLSDANMLPALTPEARILRFGYDSLWLGKEPIRTRLPTIADKLLLVLARERQEHPRRPLIFIGHCFGGLVIQRALITAKLYPETEAEEGILNATMGAVFLGTPHRGTGAFGSQSTLLAAIAAQSELYPAMEAGVLEAMEAEGGGFLDVSQDFLKLSTRMNLRVTCFFEQRESNLGKMVGRSDIRVRNITTLLT